MSKMSQIGSVWTKKDGTGHFIKLGNQNKNEKYNLTVELTVRDSSGKVVSQITDGFLTLIDPREKQGANLDALAKVPNLRYEVLVSNEPTK